MIMMIMKEIINVLPCTRTHGLVLYIRGFGFIDLLYLYLYSLSISVSIHISAIFIFSANCCVYAIGNWQMVVIKSLTYIHTKSNVQNVFIYYRISKVRMM